MGIGSRPLAADFLPKRLASKERVAGQASPRPEGEGDNCKLMCQKHIGAGSTLALHTTKRPHAVALSSSDCKMTKEKEPQASFLKSEAALAYLVIPLSLDQFVQEMAADPFRFSAEFLNLG